MFQNHGTGYLFWLVSSRQATKTSKHYLISTLNTSDSFEQKANSNVLRHALTPQFIDILTNMVISSYLKYRITRRSFKQHQHDAKVQSINYSTTFNTHTKQRQSTRSSSSAHIHLSEMQGRRATYRWLLMSIEIGIIDNKKL